ncbi:hypothetical protein Tco_0601835, partial [Tanacetum coccineum]
IIMAQQQHATNIHPDELCPPNKRYDLMDANKKVDLDHLLSYVSMDCNRAQFWHTLKEDGSKYRLRFMLDKRELTLTLDDFRQIFHLPQATANNHNSFVPPPSFSDMVPFYKQVLGLQLELKTQSNFKTTGLLQPWQTLCKIFSKCLTTRVTGWDQPPLQIMQMLYCFVNNIHVDYAELLWEGLYYSLHRPTSLIPYLRFTKIIVNYYMTIFPDISRRARDMSIINLQMIDFMRSTRLTPPAPVPPMDKADETILQDPLQVSLAEHKSREEQEARENMALIPGTRIEPQSDKESPEVEISKEKEVEISKEKEVEQTNVVIPVNVNDEDEEITDEVYELKRLEKGKIVEETRNSPILTPIRSLRIHINLERGNIHAQILTQIKNAIANLPFFLVRLQQQYQLYLAMKADPQLEQQDIEIWLALHMKFERNTCKAAEDIRTDSYALDDDEIPTKQYQRELYGRSKGNSGPEKIVLSLHKFPVIIFNDDDIEERTYRWELGHEHKFITEIVARRANDCIVSITEPDYKNLNKNDIEDIYLLIMNGKVPDYADTGLLWSLSVFIRRIEDHEMFSIIYEPVHGIIYKNSKKEKWVMRHLEIHKFYDATLNRVLEEDIEERLKHQRQMRRWEIVRNHTEAYQIFVEMLKKFVRDDLVKLWHLVKERFSTKKPTDDKEKELWVLN